MKLLNECSSLITVPWNHYNINNSFKEDTLNELLMLIKTVKFNPAGDTFRDEYFLHKSHKIDIVDRVIDQFLHKDNLDFLSKKDSRFVSSKKILRVSIWKDYPGFALPIHTDSKHKLMTMQIYLPTNNETGYGTNFYDEDQNFVYRSQYELNNGYLFFPNYNETQTWHSYDTPIKTQRTSIIFNIMDYDSYIKKCGPLESTPYTKIIS